MLKILSKRAYLVRCAILTCGGRCILPGLLRPKWMLGGTSERVPSVSVSFSSSLSEVAERGPLMVVALTGVFRFWIGPSANN